ncbi:MAG: TRAP transporter substrate-binding protein [Betaproteobacteria bacterium]|nr:TRAP transporter substrate-binding protein [Betaproteobacteria bacterium]
MDRYVIAAAVSLGFNAMLSPIAFAQAPAAAPARSIKMQSTWPASNTLQEHFKMFAERVDKLSGGSLKIEAMAAGQIVPAFEVLDATNKKVIDGWHAIAYYWVGKNPAAALFAAPPGGPFGMDHMDFLGWLHVGGGLEMWREFYQNDLKLNVIVWPAHPSSPQAFGWFKKPLRSVADIKGLKCRQTGLNADVYAKMGMSVVNMPGGEIVPAAQRGVIDCAEWVGGVEDLRLGLHSVFKYHYTPGMHENNSIGELGFNLDIWKSFTPLQQEVVNSAVKDTFITWLTRWQKQNADAMEEFTQKHGVQIRRTPPDILIASLKAWDEVAAENSAKSPIFKKIYESQRAYAAKVVPSKRYMFPPYSFAANYYWPQENQSAAEKKAAKK